MASTDLLEELRPPAFAIAYRMLGSVSEAEDVVQEGLLRLHHVLESGEQIESPRAYVSTVVTRLAIDQLRSARARRETYPGEWLPEPLVAAEEGDPAWEAELADSLSFAFLVVLESLSPEQRAAFLLREVFDYPYDRIAAIVGKNEDNVRQLVTRARRHVAEHKPRYEPSEELRNELAQRFIAAAREGELGQLESLLAEDVVLHGDGGGKAPALARPLHGRVRVAKAFSAWAHAAARAGDFELRMVEVNGQPGALAIDTLEQKIISVLVFDIVDGRIQAISGIVNPDKLRHLGPVADARAFLKRASSPRSSRRSDRSSSSGS